MYILGLTGSIAMGKSTVLGMFASRGIPVFDSDAEVRKLLKESPRLGKAIKEKFSEACQGDNVDRAQLAKIVFSDELKLRQLENLIHPRIMRRIRMFINQHSKKDAPLVVIDVPLLFEAGSEDVFDGVAVVSAPADVQEQRAMARPDMTKKRLSMILARQTPDAEKTERADFIIPTGGSLKATRSEVDTLIIRLLNSRKTDG